MVLGCSATSRERAVLGVANGEPLLGQLDVSAVKRDRLADPHAGHRQQPDQRLDRWRPSAASGSCRAARISASISASEYRYGTARRNLAGSKFTGGTSCRGSDRLQVAGEPAHDRQPLMPPHDAGVCWLQSPTRSASAVVITVACRCSRNSANCGSTGRALRACSRARDAAPGSRRQLQRARS